MRRDLTDRRDNGTLKERMAVLETKVEGLKDHLCAKIDPLKETVDEHGKHFANLFKELLELNRNLSLFKGKVIGAALAGSAFISIIATLLTMHFRG